MNIDFSEITKIDQKKDEDIVFLELREHMLSIFNVAQKIEVFFHEKLNSDIILSDFVSFVSIHADINNDIYSFSVDNFSYIEHEEVALHVQKILNDNLSTNTIKKIYSDFENTLNFMILFENLTNIKDVILKNLLTKNNVLSYNFLELKSLISNDKPEIKKNKI